MKAALRLIPLIAFVCAMAPARAADLSGAWKGAFDFNGESIPVTINLKADATTLTGSIEGLPTTPTDIHDGKIAGDTVTFWANTDYQGQTYKIVFNGKVNGDQIDFSFGTDDGTWGTTLTVKREGAPAASPAPAAAPGSPAPAAPAAAPAPDISGLWKGDFEFNGNSMPITFNLQSKGAAVTGKIEGMGAAPIEIHDGKIDSNTVTFWINTDYQGQTYTLNYTGKISPDQIDFNFGTSDGSWGATLTAKKSPPPPAVPEN
jgi:hypothetical protein